MLFRSIMKELTIRDWYVTVIWSEGVVRASGKMYKDVKTDHINVLAYDRAYAKTIAPFLLGISTKTIHKIHAS